MSKRINLVRSRRGFYRDNYNKVCVTLLVGLASILLASVMLLYLTIFRPTPDFYAASTDGEVIRLVPLNSPVATSPPPVSS